MISHRFPSSALPSGDSFPYRDVRMALGWMTLISLLGVCVLGFLMDSILRNILENKEREILASRYLTVRITYARLGLTEVQHLLQRPGFADYYVRLTAPDGDLLVERSPGLSTFSKPALPMPTLEGSEFVSGWREARSDRGLDFDLYSHSLPDGSTLLMGFCERSDERFFHRVDRIIFQISGACLALGVCGALAFLYPLGDVRS